MSEGSSRDPEAELPHLTSVRADNPGPMTLTGTNTYVIHDEDEVWVVDPGPLDAKHLAQVILACGSSARPRGVLVTHRHEDHAGGAATLRRQLENRFGEEVPLWAEDRRSVPGSQAVPTAFEGDHGVVAHIIHLPGHTVDSVGVLVQGGRLLSGDTLLGDGSSTVISAPDGDVAAHLQSLAVLRAMAIDGRIAEIMPGHGSPLTSPLEAIDAIESMIEHRRERIEHVRQARANGALTIEKLMRAVYGPDLEPGLRSAAEQNLRAMLAYLSTNP
jgi:glyoxylase-like metal-dependent hydrolase (beta-lactamase superfamily II)